MKFKFKFNLKLTSFLVSLFLGLLLVVLGSKNKYCLSFGFMVLGVSMFFLIWYNNEKTALMLTEVSQQIDTLEAENYVIEDDEEYVYVMKQLYGRKKYLTKHKKISLIMFALFGVALIILGIVGLF